MCGIAGYFDLRRERVPERQVLERMCRQLVHRGPDSDGFYIDGHVGLGFRRLSIIDIPGGSQPLHTVDGTLSLICNGEIYNHMELAAQLRESPRFRTRSDVEVLLPLYREHGAAFLPRVNGQFAFALYDKPAQKLLLARDHFGVCPLYYAVFDDVLVFASEIKAILAHPLATRSLDPAGLDQVLTYPGVVSPRTMFANIHSLPSGHLLVAHKGRLVCERYWDIPYPEQIVAQSLHQKPSNDTEIFERLAELFDRAVTCRLRADVPVGVYVSGGLDSSLIATTMRRLRPQQEIASFSIQFPQLDCDESGFQAQAAREARTAHTAIPFGIADIDARLRLSLWHGECPVKESYNTCSHALSQTAKAAGVSVVLSGEGADELFGGYLGYRFDQHGERHVADDLDSLLERDLNQRLWGDETFFYERSYFSFRDTKRALYSTTLRAQLEQFDCTSQAPFPALKLAHMHPLQRRSYLDFHLRLADHLVADHGDRMGLAHGVEGRYPFLDRELVEFVATLSPNAIYGKHSEKPLLKRLAAGRVPQSIIEREKFPFHAPGSSQLVSYNAEWFNDVLSSDRIRRQGCFDPDQVERLKKIYTAPGFALRVPYDDDLLLFVLSCSLLSDLFVLPAP